MSHQYPDYFKRMVPAWLRPWMGITMVFLLSMTLGGCGGDDTTGTTTDGGLKDAKADVVQTDSGVPGDDSGPGPGTDAGKDAGPTTTYTIGGTVSGLTAGDGGAGLVLTKNGSNDVTVNANGAFTFSAAQAAGSTYTVTVKTQPAGQTCTVSAGTGTVAAANVTTVVVNCSAGTKTIGGTLSGLAASTSVVLTNNGSNDLTLNANGTYAFSTPLAVGATYAVAVKTQPAGQNCVVANATGTVGAANVTNANVTCSAVTRTIGGTLSGLVGSGPVVLQNNGGNNLSLAANGAFTFNTPVNSGSAYAVTVLTNPSSPAQTCTVANGSGTANANVTNVAVTCSANTYTVGGTLTGLTASNTITLQNNGGDNLTLNADGSFTFATPVASGGPFAVTISAQPSGQNCTVSGGTGTVSGGNVTSVVVNCASTFTVGGTVSGLGGGTLILQNNGGDNLSINSNGSFAFPLPLVDGAAYSVAVVSQPSGPTQTCTVTNGSGNIAGANVTSVSIACTTNAFRVGGIVSGLAAGEQFTIRNNGNGETIPVGANGNFVFPTSVASGATYDAEITVQPTGTVMQNCVVANGSGTVVASNVNNIEVTCTAIPYSVGGTLGGLAPGATVVLQNNGGDNLTLTNNGEFTFATQVPSNQPYNVTVLTQPGVPSQTCLVTSGSGTVTNAAVTSVVVTCSTNSFTVGGQVVGLDTSSGNTVTVQINGGETQTVASNTAFTFPTPLLSGTTYNVLVSAQPTSPAQTCNVSAGSGTVGDSNYTGIVVNCATNTYTVGGTVEGLANGSTVVLQNNGGNDASINANGTFSFTVPVASGAGYAVTVLTNPSSPISQTCTVTNGSGTVAAANITNVSVTCSTNSFTIGGTVSGLAGSGLVLRNNGGDDLPVNANGTFTFSQPVTSGLSYNVVVQTDPTGPQQVCTASNTSGVVVNANITNVTVTCVTVPYNLSVQINGLVTATPVTITVQNGGDALSFTGNDSGTFATQVLNGSPYNVTISAQPANTILQSQTCNVAFPAGNMPTNNVTVQVYCGRTCRSIHQANPTQGNGLQLIDPDGSGPITQFNAFCDMLFDGGGWTLAESTTAPLGPTQCSAGPVQQNSCTYMPTATVQALANLSSRVHVRSVVLPFPSSGDPTVYATSTADTVPIANLRQGRILNFGVPLNDSTTQRSYWNLVGNPASRVDFSCDVTANPSWPNVYWACGNNQGWHLIGNDSRWNFGSGDIPLETYTQ